MPRASTKVFKKRRGVFNKGRCNKSNDGCGESNSTVPKNSADEKNCADGAKLCTNETEPSARRRHQRMVTLGIFAVPTGLKVGKPFLNTVCLEKRKLDVSGASEINRLYPESRKKGRREMRYQKTLPKEEAK
ncbi:hypothetical protein TNCV_256601 [Trichonephila clavipes]|nr:hypothetical protein TNCV_256601 [Trichonephila clavipes]